jgi:hypothetical protein
MMLPVFQIVLLINFAMLLPRRCRWLAFWI